MFSCKSLQSTGSGYGSGGTVVASDIKDPWFESSHWQILFSIDSIEKTKKRPGKALLF